MRYSHQTHDTVRRWRQSLSAPMATVFFVCPTVARPYPIMLHWGLTQTTAKVTVGSLDQKKHQ